VYRDLKESVSTRRAMVAHPDPDHPAVVPELQTAQHHLQQLPLFVKVSF